MYKVALCEDEQIFLHVFLKQGERHDLVLLDIIMDGIDGMELATYGLSMRSFDYAMRIFL